MEITITNATKYIKDALILDNVSMKLQSGRIYGLQGPNGSGKTMLMRLISGLIRATEGEVLINGKKLGYDMDFYDSMGLLIESPAFLPNYTGFRNLELLAKIKNKIDANRIRETLSAVGLRPDDPRKYKKYSLGMKQRLGIAAAIMEYPNLILLDEPMNALDDRGCKQIYDLLLAEKKRGALIILACHDAELLESIADEIFSISDGVVRKKVDQ